MASFLANLPARGAFVSPTKGAVVSCPPAAYVADHDTAPPASQVVTTDPTNILIRSLQQKKAKEEARRKQEKGKAVDRGKRPAAEAADERGGKRAASGAAAAGSSRPASASGANEAAGAGAGPSRPAPPLTSQQLHAKTNKELTDLLKARGLPTKGKKDELVKRILDQQDKERPPARGQ